MNRRRPRKASEVASFADLRTYYDQAIAELDECHRQRRAIESVNKANRKDLLDTRGEAKSAKRKIVQLTEREHAKSKEKSAAAYATTAATMLIIGYQVVEVAGGWGRWAPVFQHEATIGVLQVMIGSILAFAMRPLQH